MKLIQAKEILTGLIQRDIEKFQIDIQIDINSPGKDIGKFTLNNKIARIISPFNGFFVNINLNWFNGSDDLPFISGDHFHYYILPVCLSGNKIHSYCIVDFYKMKEWVLEFKPTNGNTHRDHKDWRGRILINEKNLTAGHFSWGDEPQVIIENRKINFNNVVELIDSSKNYSNEFKNFTEDFEQQVSISLSDSPETRLKRISTAELYPEQRTISTNVFYRNPDIVAQTLWKAGGFCEKCKSEAPFIRKSDNTPYLEVHHVTPLSKGGQDSLENSIALCPNCHRELHFGIDK